MRIVLLISFLSSSILANQESLVWITPQCLSPSSTNSVYLMKDKQGFFALDKSTHQVKRIEPYNVSEPLRSMSVEELTEAFSHGYIKISENEQGDFYLEFIARLAGGGVGGTAVGAYTGKFVVHFVSHSTIGLIAWFTGPAAPFTAASLEATFITTIEAASNVGALIGGLIGGLFTGPV